MLSFKCLNLVSHTIDFDENLITIAGSPVALTYISDIQIGHRFHVGVIYCRSFGYYNHGNTEQT